MMNNKNKIGLALGSGGAKGIAHISVIEFIEKKGLSIDYISGSSVGALIGAIYLCGNLKKFKSEVISFTKADLFSLMSPVIPVSGLMNPRKMMTWLEKFIPADITIESLPKPLSIIASEYHSGEQVIFSSGNLLSAVRASISIPGIFEPVRYENRILIDGGVVNPLPVDVVKKMGADRVIAVNLHPALKTHNNAVSASFAEGNLSGRSKPRTLEKITELSEKINYSWLKKFTSYFIVKSDEKKDDMPNVFEVIFQTIDIMDLKNTELLLKYSRPDLLLEPNLLSFGSLEFYRSIEALVEGDRVCREKEKEIEELLK
jgi:NTE family protein